MKTGSLRRRVTLTTSALLAIVLAPSSPRSRSPTAPKLDGDLRARLTQAGAAVERASHGGR